MFYYTIKNLVPGLPYKVRLHFAETWSLTNSAGDRLFDVSVNSELAPRLKSYDIYANAIKISGQTGTKANGRYIAVIETLTVNAMADGKITVIFTKVKGTAYINGLEILSP